mgnify:CR=1 FL=1
MADLQFYEETHTYRYGGKVVPSVTQVLQAEGISDFSMVPADVLETACARGNAVHLATQYLDEGRLDWSTVGEGLAGYLAAWERFKEECRVEVLEIERRVYYSMGYAGTLDRVLLMQRMRWLIDIKSGAPTPAAAIQTAAYQFAHPDKDKINRRAAVQLNADGTYKLHQYDPDSMHDLNIFIAALTIYEYKRRK